LPRLGLPAGVSVPGDHTLAVGEEAEAGERPAADLPAEGFEDATDLPYGDALLEQTARGAQQDQVDEVEVQPPAAVARGSDQPGVHAAPEPCGRQPDDARRLRRVEVGASVADAPRAHLLLVRAPGWRGRLAPLYGGGGSALRGPRGSRHLSLLAARLPPGEALLQRLHEVDHLGALGGRGRDRHLLARHLLLDHLRQPIAVLVAVPVGTEFRRRELVDEPPRKLDLRIAQLHHAV